LLHARLRRSSGTRLAPFHYEILEVLDTGAADPLAIARHLQPVGSWGIIYPTRDGVCTESVDEAYYRLVERLDGTVTPSEAATRLAIPPDDALEFLKFALREGIIETA
jgi:hypothetical protein